MTTQEVTLPTQKGSDYSRLSKLVRDAGLLRRRPVYYTVKIAITVLLFAAGWVAFFIIGDSWWNLILAVYLAVMCTQIAFIGHDAGHMQIFSTREPNYRLGIVLGNLLIGMSTGWWIHKHNEHHANPNHEDKDPDVAPGAVVYTSEQARLRSWFGRWISRHQAGLFFPMLLLEGLNLHKSSVDAMLSRTIKSRRDRAIEAGLLLVNASLYVAAVIVVLSPVQGIVFMALHQALWGLYMGICFAPNHKGMPILKKGHKLDYLRKQVLTSRNIRGGRFTDLFLGGLNYQIEHHLFPSMPRPGLVRSTEIIRPFCEQLGVPFTVTSFWESYRAVLGHFNEVGADV